MIEVRYFANLRESLGVAHEQVELPAVATIAGLLDVLKNRHGKRGEQVFGGPRLLCALNHDVVPYDTSIKDGDEVAFFPPVTGG